MLPVVVGVEGEVLTPRERELFAALQPAGYILFRRNIGDYELVRELTDELRLLTQGPDEPIIAIDQEGGRVVRTSSLRVELPSAAALALCRDASLTTQAAYYNARCLLTLGVNTDFAPVLDLASTRANALPGRCWGSEPQEVITHAGVWNRALQRRGILTCGKHFPGMGEAEVDPHHDLPVLRGGREEFLRQASVPFTALMPELPSLMIAHLRVPDIDPERPSSLSRPLVQGFLREQLGYEGLVFTDDLCMGAIRRSYRPEEAARLALEAGCDLPLICHQAAEHLEDVARALEDVPQEVMEAVARRVERFRLMIAAMPPMTFLEWNEYLKDVQAFCRRVPEPAAAALPSSPVQDY